MENATSGFEAADRAVLRIGGAEARGFLQGLVTNDVRRLDDGPV
jgi:folate-binding Fe-S cluster repair protein YgfZ